MIFLMDSSKYVTVNNYILEKNFVKLMARLLNLANNRSRAALFTFGDRAQLVINFGGYQDREAFDASVNVAPHQQGNRHIDEAFDSAAKLLQTDSRATVPKYVILLTTGKQTLLSDSRSLANTSRNVQSSGGKVFVVAVLTGGYTISEFYPAVQRPEDAFSVSSFVDLLPRAPIMAAQMMASWRKWKLHDFFVLMIVINYVKRVAESSKRKQIPGENFLRGRLLQLMASLSSCETGL